MAALVPSAPVQAAVADQPETRITHSFLATGQETYVLDDAGKVTWRYPRNTRDGWILPSGNALLAVTKCGDYPHGAVVEVTHQGKTVFEFKGTQSEVNTVEPLEGDRVLLTEAGDHPRLLEVDRAGKIVVEVPLSAQTKDHHLQTRMARKLANGNYLVPQLLDRVVREYTPKGKVVWEVSVPSPSMPFTAIRLDNGNTLIDCTHGDRVIEVDSAGKTVWELTNADLHGPLIHDACGGQRLPNGDTVITSYAIGKDHLHLFEVTPQKNIVWTYSPADKPGVHELQILTTNGKPLTGRPLR
jgi:hypothetical protein